MNNDRPVFQPYPAYKDSGVPWLGEIPAHWEVKRGKHLFRCIDVRSKTGEEELLTVSSEHGVVPRKSANVTMFKAESYVGYKLCWPDDLVINSLWAWARGLGVSRYHGITSSAYGVYRLREETEGDPWFIHQLVRSVPFHWELQVRSKGIWTSRLQLTDESFLGAPFPVPPPDEQRAIARFLEAIDRLTRRYISAQRRLIALLTEQKQALIQQAVTRGLNPDAPLKDSGIEWLGEIPAHWLGLPLKRWVSTKITDGPHETPPLLDSGVDFLSAESIVNGHFDFEHRRGYISPELHAHYCQKCRPQLDDIFMCKSGATTGKVARVEDEREFSVWSPLALIRADPAKAIPKLVYYVLQSRYIQQQVQQTWSAGTQPNLSMGAMERLFVVLPQSLDEQNEVLDSIEQRIVQLDSLIVRSQRQIDLAREYRTRLIADVVTGKLDVRGVALPVEVGRTSESASHLDEQYDLEDDVTIGNDEDFDAEEDTHDAE